MIVFGLVISVLVIAFFVFSGRDRVHQAERPISPTPKKWQAILSEKVNFYRNLDGQQRMQFEADIQRFLGTIRISGVQVNVGLADRLLIASSAVIPLFGFPAWSYQNLDEVLLYPGSFDRDYVINSKKEVITGMVGSGAMEGKMILSKPSLHLGFDIANDKKNVGIHEFVHLFDKETGAIDGIPPGFEERAYSLPWLDFVQKKTNEIIANKSDINDYGATNRQEFFAVASEYFFERPHLLMDKHPKLYDTLTKVFNQDMATVIDKSSFESQASIGRNDRCLCGSGLKYKHCCIDGSN
jgi:Mlc titration factor MtfA (ptsG expression regulator)